MEIAGHGGNDTLIGGPGNDGFVADSFALEIVSGKGGNDLIDAGSGNDFVIADDDAIFGDHWADTGGVQSGAGFDVCRGGPGTDSAASCEVIREIP